MFGKKLIALVTLLHFICPVLAQVGNVPKIELFYDSNAYINKIIVKKVLDLKLCKLYKDSVSENAIMGQWRLADKHTVFTPVLPLDSRQVYSLNYSDEDGKPQCKILRSSIKRKMTSPEVTAIYPTALELPENILRFYIVFSEPMREDSFLSHISLYDEQGTSLSGVFLPSSFEYWNKERTMITLILDPARVKTGLIANKAHGRAIVEGRRYTLKVHASCSSMQGVLLKESVTKEFSVTGEQRKAVNPNQWKVTLPQIGSRQPLILSFRKAIDYVNARSFIAVMNHWGCHIKGKARMAANEKQWLFTPNTPWKKENFTIFIDKRLEDVCGNNLYSAFDAKNTSSLSGRISEKTYRIHVFLD